MHTFYKIVAVSCTAVGVALTAGPALAAVSVSVPEPGILSLLGVAGIITAIVANRRRFK